MGDSALSPGSALQKIQTEESLVIMHAETLQVLCSALSLHAIHPNVSLDCVSAAMATATTINHAL